MGRLEKKIEANHAARGRRLLDFMHRLFPGLLWDFMVHNGPGECSRILGNPLKAIKAPSGAFLLPAMPDYHPMVSNPVETRLNPLSSGPHRDATPRPWQPMP
jgi:hypothetical protein